MTLAGAASAMGVPEPLVRRSAEARSKVSGIAVESILTAWAGGTAPSAPAPTPAETATPPAVPAAEEPQPKDKPEMPPDTPPPVESPAPRSVQPTVEATPILVGRKERPLAMVFASAAAVAAALLVPILGADSGPPEGLPRTSEIQFSDSATAGREAYVSQSCDACHTQLIRPLVADASADAVIALADTNLVLGLHRYGPDLSHAFPDPALVAEYLKGLNGHPVYLNVADQDLSDLVAYLTESR